MKIPFSPPDISDSEITAVIQTLQSGWITTGPKVKEFEQQIANFVDADWCVCLNSQTACAEMVLRVLGIGPGDEVITSAYTYTATAAVIHHVGAKIILIDTQENSLEMDYEALKNAITEKTKAIIPVDIAGVPCDYDRIFKIVQEKQHLFMPHNKIQSNFGRIIIIADTAHALGATYHQKKVGSIADFSNFSFHAVKNLTTAEGGAITWKSFQGINNEELYRQFQLLSLHGQSKSALEKNILNSWEYDVIGPYYKCNMTDLSAAIGLKQLQRYPELLQKRKNIINQYNKGFNHNNIKTLSHFNSEYNSSGHLYLTWIPNITEQQRNEIIKRMGDLGISCNVHYKPLPMLTAYKNLGFNIKDYPNAYKHFSNEISLPLHTHLTEEEIQYIIYHYNNIIKDYC